MDPYYCIFFQLAKASQAGTRFWQESVSRFNVTAVQAMVLSFLSEKDRVSSGFLGQKVQLDSATLTGILDRLAKAGFLERKPNPDDRRAILICLTPRGKEIGRRVLAMVPERNQAFLSALTPEEEMIFRTLLKKLVSHVK